MNDDREFLLLSGLSHFAFCRRRWALIHIEQLWLENTLTQEGHYLHERVHDASFTEKRGSTLLSRAMPVRSESLRVTGTCDMVEMSRHPGGVPIQGREGRWRLYPVEYKHGRPDAAGAACLQLCAQAMCLEEMFVTDIPEGAIYSASERRRHIVEFTQELRDRVSALLQEMHKYFDQGYTPKSKVKACCRSCSMHELCQPEMLGVGSAEAYVARMLKEDGA